MPSQNDLLNTLLRLLDDNQANRVVTIDVHDQTTVTDYMVVAGGRSSRQVKSMASNIAEHMKAAGFRLLGSQGLESTDSGDWSLLDFGDCVLHIMQPDARALYDIEGLWQVEHKNNHTDTLEAHDKP